MASWILVPCLVSLRNEFNALAPNRDKASDGSIGDTSHAASSSDHNPDETGTTPYEDADSINEVHAIDVDSDLRKSGWTMQRAVNVIVDRHRSGADDRLQNVIYNRRIASRSWGWTWRDYTGSSPHTEHAHFSSRYTTSQESNTKAWGLLAEEEDDMPTAAEVAKAIWEYALPAPEDMGASTYSAKNYLMSARANARGSWLAVNALAAQRATIATALSTVIASDDVDEGHKAELRSALDKISDDSLASFDTSGITPEEAAAMLKEMYGEERAAQIGDLLVARPV